MAEDPLKVAYHDGVAYKYSTEWTKRLEDLRHWQFYWYQQKLMEGCARPDERESILELGVGSGFAANYCRSKGFDVTTLDIDAEKKPDIVANAANYNFRDKYDHLMAFEILEHMPYTEFEKIIRKVPTFVRRYAFISLPRNERSVFSLHLKLPKTRAIKWDYRILAGQIKTQAHFWELDHRDTTSERVEDLFEDAGLKIEKRIKKDYIMFYALAVE